MKRQLRAIGLAAAIAATGGFAAAQTGTAQQPGTGGTTASPTAPPTHPTQQPGAAPGTTASPSTPPTHPTERTTPSTRPSTQDPAVRGQGAGVGRSGTQAGGASAEAMQACKNLSAEQERKECMDRARRAGASTDSSGKSEAGSEPNPSGTSGGKWGGDKGDAPSK